MFANTGVRNDSCESTFKFLARKGGVKGIKITGLYACHTVKYFQIIILSSEGSTSD